VHKLDADGQDTTFGAKRLILMAANLNEMEEHRQHIIRELSAAPKRAATSLPQIIAAVPATAGGKGESKSVRNRSRESAS
jgi:hypothetical protein